MSILKKVSSLITKIKGNVENASSVVTTGNKSQETIYRKCKRILNSLACKLLVYGKLIKKHKDIIPAGFITFDDLAVLRSYFDKGVYDLAGHLLHGIKEADYLNDTWVKNQKLLESLTLPEDQKRIMDDILKRQKEIIDLIESKVDELKEIGKTKE